MVNEFEMKASLNSHFKAGINIDVSASTSYWEYGLQKMMSELKVLSLKNRTAMKDHVFSFLKSVA